MLRWKTLDYFSHLLEEKAFVLSSFLIVFFECFPYFSVQVDLKPTKLTLSCWSETMSVSSIWIANILAMTATSKRNKQRIVDSFILLSCLSSLFLLSKFKIWMIKQKKQSQSNKQQYHLLVNYTFGNWKLRKLRTSLVSKRIIIGTICGLTSIPIISQIKNYESTSVMRAFLEVWVVLCS